MATAAKLTDVAANESTGIALIVSENPVVVLTDRKQREAFYAHIEREVEAFSADVSTAKGRDAIKSLAFKITRTKTAIDAAGKQLNEDARARINAVDAERRAAREKLGEMADKVRQPLTDWEDVEKKRVERAEELMAGFQQAAIVTTDDTSATIRARGKQVYETEVVDLGSMQEQVQAIKDGVIGTLKSALAYAIKEEADRAELEKLRAEAAARAEADRIAAEQAEQARLEAQRIEADKLAAEEAKAEAERQAQLAEERRIAAEKAEQERITSAERAAAEQAQREAESKAMAEQVERDRAHAEVLAAESKAREDAERELQMEREAVLQAEKHRKAMADQLAAEQAQRDADQKHRTKVKAAAKTAIMSCGADEETARKVVMAIIANEVPNVSLRF